jgi:hypothetical protein
MAKPNNRAGFAAVITYLVTGAVLSTATYLILGWWAVPIALVATFIVFTLVWHIIRDRWPKWTVVWWLRRHGVNRKYADIFRKLGKHLRMRQLRDVPSTLAVIRFYRHDGHGYMADSDLAELLLALQGSDAVALGEDTRYYFQAMYGRTRQNWRPAPASLRDWLTRIVRLREAGVERDTIIAYLEQVPPGAALDALENGVPVEYAVR